VRVAVIIPVRQINDYIREALPYFAAQTYRDFEVIVVPNLATVDQLEGVRIIPSWPATGPAEKRQLGARSTDAELLAFIDDDAYPAPDWLERAVGHFEREDIQALGGPNVTPPQDGLRAQAGGWVLATKLGSGGNTYRFQPEAARDIDDFASVNLFVLRSAFEAVGGFDSDYWPGEDTKLCADIRYRLGGRIRYVPDVVVYHHRRPLFGAHLRQHARYGIHRGHFARVLPNTSRRPLYFAPAAFVAGLVGGGVTSMFVRRLRPIYLAALAVYLLAVLIASGSILRRSRDPAVAALAGAGIVATHVTYGAMFLRGFFGPAPRRYYADKRV
jgi:GT2 family glycosyltransferase